jgi:hypothetical protein
MIAKTDEHPSPRLRGKDADIVVAHNDTATSSDNLAPAPPPSPTFGPPNRPPPGDPKFKASIEFFISESKDWADAIKRQGYMDHSNLEYLKKCLSKIKLFALKFDRINRREYQYFIVKLHALIATKIPWNLLSENDRLIHFAELFSDATFRYHFVYYYCCSMYNVVVASNVKPSTKVFHPERNPCDKHLLVYLHQYEDVNELLQKFPLRKNTVFRQTNETLLDSCSDAHQNSPTQSQDPVVTVCDEETDNTALSTHLKVRKAPSRTPPEISARLNKALSDVTDAFAQVVRKEQPAAHEMRRLSKLKSTAHQAVENPNWEDIHDLLDSGEKYCDSTVPSWKILGIALISLAGALAIVLGALAIAMSLGAISSGILSPLGTVGVTAGLGIVTAGWVTLTVGIGLFCEQNQTNSTEQLDNSIIRDPCISY